MKNLLYLSLAMYFFCATQSCASIVSQSKYNVAINSDPAQATITIHDRSGQEIYRGLTPANIILDAGHGFFQRASYVVTFEKPGFATQKTFISTSMDGWYFGNLLIGGIIGMLVVDPATGAMYQIDQTNITTKLAEDFAQTSSGSLEIYTVEDIPEGLRSHLKPIEAATE